MLPGCCRDQRGEGGHRLQKTSVEGSRGRGRATLQEGSQTLAGGLGLHGENHPWPFLSSTGPPLPEM